MMTVKYGRYIGSCILSQEDKNGNNESTIITLCLVEKAQAQLLQTQEVFQLYFKKMKTVKFTLELPPQSLESPDSQSLDPVMLSFFVLSTCHYLFLGVIRAHNPIFSLQ